MYKKNILISWLPALSLYFSMFSYSNLGVAQDTVFNIHNDSSSVPDGFIIFDSNGNIIEYDSNGNVTNNPNWLDPSFEPSSVWLDDYQGYESRDIRFRTNQSGTLAPLLNAGDYKKSVDDNSGRQILLAPPSLAIGIDMIFSTVDSGLGMGLINQQLIRGAPDAALRGLNTRLFRARSGMKPQSTAQTSTFSGNSSLLRYFAFVQDEHVDSKVALGLADGVERTIEVKMIDSLSAQNGINMHNQSHVGGLPYALLAAPLVSGATTVKIIEAGPYDAKVLDRAKSVIETAPTKRWEAFVSGDFSHYDQDSLDEMLESFDTETYAGSIGVEYHAKEWLNIGLAWTYLQSEAAGLGGLGDLDLNGNLISAYATGFWDQNWADILYSYGSFDSDILRNTGLLGGKARGETDSDSHNIRLNIGRNIQVTNNIVTGPIAGLRYSSGSSDPYSENGGGLAMLNYDDTDFESMQSQVGWQASHLRPTGWGRIVSQVHLGWEHEYMPENGTVGVSMQTSPFTLGGKRVGGFSAESDGEHPGTDWMSAGVGLSFELDRGWTFLTDYQGAFFRSGSTQHYVSAKVNYKW
ncbi:MAG: autotransporter outer membrane beta-barrel domain-containing protein [Verrucomicrobiota bacterium]